jgi:hypothetical protein
MTKSWVSGGKSTEMTEKLQQEVLDLEARRDELVEKNKRKVFEWSSFVFNSNNVPASVEALLNHALSADVKDVLLEYDSLNQTILGKQVRLNEKLDEQAKFDSLG